MDADLGTSQEPILTIDTDITTARKPKQQRKREERMTESGKLFVFLQRINHNKNEMKKIMEYVVSEGGGSGAQIAGYRIGGKTGTADKAEDGQYRGNTYSSFIGMAPMDDPKFVCLVVVDSPQGVRYGGLIAAPIAKDFMENALPYLNISPSYTQVSPPLTTVVCFHSTLASLYNGLYLSEPCILCNVPIYSPSS